MSQHPFSPIGDSPYCAHVYGLCDDEVCGEGEEAAIHLSDDVENDRFVPFDSKASMTGITHNRQCTVKTLLNQENK